MSATTDAMNLLSAPPAGERFEPTSPPTFSVIIAAYQAASFVGESVASALDQTLPFHEVIVCDDGSTDDIEGALEPYLDRIEFLRLEHGGEAAAKNAGLERATGDFVTVLDSDDKYLPERNELVTKAAMARPDLDILTTRAFLEVDGEVVATGDRNWVFEPIEQRKALLQHCFVMPASAARRSRVLEIGGWHDLPGTTDWDLWLRLVFSGSRIGRIEKPLARYQLREDSLSHNRSKQVRAEVKQLEKAAAGLEMDRDERAALVRELSRRRREAEIQEARDALLDGAPDARRRSLALVTARGHRVGTRLKGGFSALAPGAARRMLAARDRKGWIGGGTWIPRKSDR